MIQMPEIYSANDIEYGCKAIDAWLNSHEHDEKYEPCFGWFLKKLPIVVFHCETDEMPWSVQYAGSGHYFKTRAEALEYFEGRIHQANKNRESQRNWRKAHPGKSSEYHRNYVLNSALKHLKAHPEELEKLRRENDGR